VNRVFLPTQEGQLQVGRLALFITAFIDLLQLLLDEVVQDLRLSLAKDWAKEDLSLYRNPKKAPAHALQLYTSAIMETARWLDLDLQPPCIYQWRRES